MTAEPVTSAAAPSTGAASLACVVIGVDDSPESLYALDLAAALGGAFRSMLTIVHVRPRLVGFAFSPAGSVEYEQAEDALDAEIRRVVGGRLEDYAGSWTVVIRSGHVADELLAVAEEVDADLVVVGHRSHGLLRDAILGSVAAGTVHNARRNVLVAVPPVPR